MIPRILQFPNRQEEMETKIYCAYNVSRDRHLSPKVAVVDKTDQPLTVMRLLVEGLGLKGDTSLWLAPLQGTPQLVRPFPFDLVYLDKNLRVVRAAELLPEVQFPEMAAEVTSALVLPLHTISATGTKAGDQLIVCAGDELEQRIEKMVSGATADSIRSKQVEPASQSRIEEKRIEDELVPIQVKPEPTPAPLASPPVFAPIATHTIPQGSGFTVALATNWQVTNSTAAVVAPGSIEAGEPERPVTAEAASDAPEKPDERASATEQNSPAEVSESGPAEQTKIARPQEVLQVQTQPNAQETETPATSFEIAVEASPGFPPEVAASVSPETNVVVATDEPRVEAEATAFMPVGGAQGDEPKVDHLGSSGGESCIPQGLKPANSLAVSGTTQSPPVVPFHKTIYEAPENDGRKEAEIPKRKSVETTARPAVPAKRRAPQKTKSRGEKPEPAKPEVQEEQKNDHLGIRVIRWLNLDDPLPDRRAKKRYLMPGLFAHDVAADKEKVHEVRDVSPAGLYLKTPRRWKPGQPISLTLCSEDAKAKTSASSVRVQARTVRSDKDGTVLSFMFPEGVEFEPWNRLHTRRANETDAEYFVRELRLALAFGFLRRICEPATEQISLALHERFSNKRLAGATEIALKAGELLSRYEDAGGLIAHPHVVTRILEEGSWAEDDWVRQMWAGLLATSCTPDGQDTSNTVLIDLLDKMTPIHLKVLAFACRKGEEVAASGESLASFTLYCSGDELVQVAGSNNLARIQQTIGHLAGYGLLVESARPSYVGAMEKIKTKTTPTALGLKLHARCNGQRV
jgi:hypothetical protein